MKTLLQILSLFSLLSLWGCSLGPGTSKLKVSIAAITGSAQFPGGLFLMGKGEGEKFVYKVKADDTLELELKHGVYDFIVMGWDGSNYYEGNVFCDSRKSLRVEGEQFDLSLGASMIGCDQNILHSGPENLGLGQFPALNIQSCSGLKKHLDAGEVPPVGMNCDGGSEGLFPGGDQSYRISLISFDIQKTRTINSFSRCLPISPSGIVLKLPRGVAGQFDIPVQIETFSDSTCASNKTTYLFDKGLATLAANNLAISAIDYTSSSHSVYLHKDQCNAAHNAGNPFAFSGSGSHLICTKAQFERIGQSGTGADYFELGSNIDFGGSNTTIMPVFSGQLRGRDYVLSNGNSPLFDSIQADGSGETAIDGIEVNNFNININGSGTNQAFGILSNRVTSAGTNKIELREISIDNSSIIVSDGGLSGAGFLGGLVGFVDFAASTNDDRIYIRNVDIKAIVDGSSSTQLRVGGVIGRAFSVNNGGQIAVEETRVGVHDRNNLDDISEQAIIRGQTKIGGIVGAGQYFEVREGVEAITALQGQDYVGGVVGDALAEVQIRNVYSKSSFIHLNDSPASRIGGIVGGVGGDYRVSIEGVVSKFTVPQPDTPNKRINLAGGILGAAESITTNDFRIFNSRSYFIYQADGDKVGGFIGSFNDSDGGSSIEKSVVMGMIQTRDELITSNIQRGGFIGNAFGININMSIVDMVSVEGHSTIGGGFGRSEEASIHEAYIRSGVQCFHASFGNCGGIIGDLVFNSNTNLFTDLKIDIQMNLPNHTGGCTAYRCGLLQGGVPLGSIMFDKIIRLGSILDSGLSEITTNCGSTECIVTTDYLNLYTDDSSGTCAAIIGAGGIFQDAASICRPMFEFQWHKYGLHNLATADILGFSEYYKAGNSIEPFPINNETEWNQIGTDAFLMEKTFMLMRDMDFSTPGFTPIGNNSTNVFKGGIIPNGNRLENINITTVPILTGLFPEVENARLGRDYDPLIINNVTVNCNAYGECGIIGKATNSDISVVATNAVIDNGNASIGLIGRGEGDLWIRNSGFQGSIPSATGDGIGGLVGYFFSNGLDGKVSIEKSFVKIDTIYGNNNIGGFVGRMNHQNDDLQIEDSYVFLNPKNLVSPTMTATIGSGENIGLIAGSVDLNSEFRLDTVFVDMTNLNSIYPIHSGAYTTGAPGAENISDYSIVGVGGFTLQNVAMVNTSFEDAQENLNESAFEREDGGYSDWATAGDGSVRLRWELESLNGL